MTTIATPDLAAVKTRQQAMWASGDYHAVAARMVLISERLCEAAGIQAGERVLDVATGSGNAALAAARCGADVIGVDYVPGLLERGRLRAAAEGLEIEFREGDAEALPVPDAAFDKVLSVYGAMFAPDHERTAAELLRACRPGGRIALVNWTPDGFVGQLLRLVGRHVPPPAGVRSPALWGSEEHLRELFGGGVESLTVTRRTYSFRFPSAEAFADFFLEYYGPTERAAAALGDGRDALRDDIVALASEHNRLDGTPAEIPSEYVEVVAIRA